MLGAGISDSVTVFVFAGNVDVFCSVSMLGACISDRVSMLGACISDSVSMLGVCI